jgi:hypothetical protein
MHIHAPHDVSVAHKATVPAGEDAPARLGVFPTGRTRAAGSPLTAREARHVGLLTLLLEIGTVFAIFPAGHPLVVMPSLALLPHPIGIADVDGLHPFLLTELHHLPGGFVPQIPYPLLRLPSRSLSGIPQTA